jgi:2-isopropylmalate synthase
MSTDRVLIFDTTLRDGEQSPGAAMTIPEKVRIAEHLARLGVDVIEAGFPISSPAQFEAIRQVGEMLGARPAGAHRPVLCALSRAVEADVRAAGESLDGVEKRRIHTFIATSDIHIQAKFGGDRYGRTLADKRHDVIRRAVEAVAYARTFTDDVEFSAEDAGRTDAAYLCEIVQAVVDAGATTINLPDTTGYCTPADMAAIFETVRACVADPDGVVFSAHCHDDLGLAVANSLAAVLAGARQIECTLNGLGERAGNAALEEIVMALRVRADRFGVSTGIDASELYAASRAVSVATGFPVAPNKAVVGRNAFSHEAGIHQHGVLQSRETYEIMRAEDVGQSPEQIRLGRHSGRHGLFSRLDKLGMPVADADRETVYRAFVALADVKKEILDEDLRHLVHATDPIDGPEAYTLDRVTVEVATDQPPRATVALLHLGHAEPVERTATGDGPVNALYRAINHAVGRTPELETYTIRSVTEGSDAIGEVTVLVSGAGGALYHGVARGTDVLQASAHAYVEALNRLAAAEVAEDGSVTFVNEAIMNSFGGA